MPARKPAAGMYCVRLQRGRTRCWADESFSREGNRSALSLVLTRNFQAVLRRCRAYLGTIFLTALVCGLAACSGGNTPNTTVPVTKLVADSYAMSLGADRFVKTVWGIATHGDTIFMIEEGTHHVLCLNTELDVIGTIGQSGPGPAEFSHWPHNFYVTKNSVHAFDYTSLEVFSHQGEYKRTIQAPFRAWEGLAVDDEENVFLSPIFGNSESSIVQLDSSGTVVNNFGDLLATEGPSRLRWPKSQRILVVVNQQYLMTIGLAIPVVEKYSLNGELIARNDLSQERFFAPRLSYAYEREKDYSREDTPISVTTVASKASVIDDMFYVLIIQGSPSKNVRKNTLLAIDIETLKLERAYELSDQEGEPLRWVTAFAGIPSGELLVYHHSDGVFYRYRL